jgi:hypothetical protein
MTENPLPRLRPSHAIALALSMSDKSGRVYAEAGDEVRLVLEALRLAGWEIVERKET